MSLVSLFKYASKPLARAGGKILEKGSLPLAGLDLFELQRSTRGAVDAVQEGDKTKAVAEGLNAYGTTLFAPTTIDIAAKSNPKIMNALGKVIPKKIKTPAKIGYNLIKKGIDKLPGSETVRKNPIRSGLGIFGGSAALEPTRDLLFGSAEAKEVETPPNIENENIFTPIKTEPNESPVETKPDSVASVDDFGGVTGESFKSQDNIEDALIKQQNLTDSSLPTSDSDSDNDSSSSDLANQSSLDTQPEDKKIKINPMTEEPEVNANKNKDGVNVLQASANNLSPDNTNPVPAFIVESSNALKKTILETKFDSDGITMSSLLGSVRVNDEILKQKFKIFEEQKEIIKNRREEFPEFSEFYEKFNKMAGKDVPDASKDFILLKFGLNLMQGTSDQQGMAGFLDIAGRAGNIAVEELQQIYMLEKEKREAMALKYLDFENVTQENLDRRELELLNSNITFLQDYQNSRDSTLEQLLNAKAAVFKAQKEIDDAHQTALDRKYELGGKGQMVGKVRSQGSFLGYDNVAFTENKRGELMTYHNGLDGSNKPYTIPDYRKILQEEIGIIKNSNIPVESKNKLIEERQALINADYSDVRDNLTEGTYDKNNFKKNLSRIQTNKESVTNLDLVANAGIKAINQGYNPYGLVGGFYNITSTLAAIFRDIQGKDIATKISNLKNGSTFTDARNALVSQLSDPDDIQEFELEGRKGEVLKGEAARLEITKRYYADFDRMMAKADGASDKEINKFFEGNELVEKQFSTADERRELFRTILIAQTQLKYSLANSFKGEDRLTEKNLNEFGELVKFVGGFKSITDVVTSINRLRDLSYERLFFELSILKNAGASETEISDLVGPDMFNKLKKYIGDKKAKPSKSFSPTQIRTLIPELKKAITDPEEKAITEVEN